MYIPVLGIFYLHKIHVSDSGDANPARQNPILRDIAVYLVAHDLGMV